MLVPLLSEEDLGASLEGAIDPLGLYAIANALAVKLVPGVRERQSRARFVTAIAVSTAVCSDRSSGEIAADRVSEPWQVFEWYMVEGLVRGGRDDTDLTGLPGVDKARQTVRDGVPLSAARYLKSPGAFGFHGVYRELARSLDIVLAGTLSDTGLELLDVWSEEQGLKGFYGSGDGPGGSSRQRLAGAVAEGMERGAVARKKGWSGWSFFAEKLAPREIGAREAQFILNALKHETQSFRRQVFRALVSPDGADTWTQTGSEREFHLLLRECADPALRDLLDAILVYERWSRLLQDAFDDCVYRMSRQRTKTTARSLAETRGVKKAQQEIPDLYPEVIERLERFGQAGRLQVAFASLGDPVGIQEWVRRLLEHHRQVQKRKLPNGKIPWFERFDDGSVIIRPAHVRDEGGHGDERYVHGYRTPSLWSFARDLGELD